MSLKEHVVIGGVDMQAQSRALASRPHVVIATPGRLAVCAYVLYMCAYVCALICVCACVLRWVNLCLGCLTPSFSNSAQIALKCVLCIQIT